MRYDSSLPIMRHYWLSCFSFTGENAALPSWEMAGSQMLGHGQLLAKLRTLPAIHVSPEQLVKTTSRNMLRFSSENMCFPVRTSRGATEGFVHSVLGLSWLEKVEPGMLRIGRLVAALTAQPADMVAFFTALVDLTIDASEQAAGFETPATIIRELREIFGQELPRLDEALFRRVVASLFQPGMVALKQTYRHECLAVIDTRPRVKGDAPTALLPEFDHPGVKQAMRDFFRKNCSVVMGAWDAFGAGLVEEAARRGVAINRPDTRNIDAEVDESMLELMDIYNRLVAAKTLGDAKRLAAKALRLILSLPAWEIMGCHNVLATMRKAAGIAPGRLGNSVYANLFGGVFLDAAREAHHEPSLAMAMQVWCSWMRQKSGAAGIVLLDHDAAVLFHNVEQGLAQGKSHMVAKKE